MATNQFMPFLGGTPTQVEVKAALQKIIWATPQEFARFPDSSEPAGYNPDDRRLGVGRQTREAPRGLARLLRDEECGPHRSYCRQQGATNQFRLRPAEATSGLWRNPFAARFRERNGWVRDICDSFATRLPDELRGPRRCDCFSARLSAPNSARDFKRSGRNERPKSRPQKTAMQPAPTLRGGPSSVSAAREAAADCATQ